MFPHVVISQSAYAAIFGPQIHNVHCRMHFWSCGLDTYTSVFSTTGETRGLANSHCLIFTQTFPYSRPTSLLRHRHISNRTEPSCGTTDLWSLQFVHIYRGPLVDSENTRDLFLNHQQWRSVYWIVVQHHCTLDSTGPQTLQLYSMKSENHQFPSDVAVSIRYKINETLNTCKYFFFPPTNNQSK